MAITRAVSWRLDPEVHAALDRRKIETGLSKTEIVHRALRAHLGLPLGTPGKGDERRPAANGAHHRPAGRPSSHTVPIGTSDATEKAAGASASSAPSAPAATVTERATELAQAGMPYRTALRIARREATG